MNECRTITRKDEQCGVYAVEFAIVFPVFFLVVYAILTYGLIFAAQQTLTFAAEDAARSALRWQSGAAEASVEKRMIAARERAVELTRWVARMAGAEHVQVQVCPRGDRLRSVAGVGGHPELCLDGDETAPSYSPDTIEVVVRYRYGLAPLVPALGPEAVFRVLLPNALYARAFVDLSIGLVHVD